jgi:hypothetical protein
MSDSPAPTPDVADDTKVPSDTQQKLRTYWQTFGPNRGVITTLTVWDDGGTVWDDGATIWPY